ncbi:CaiF/GrlA family transcriptional regulator [Yersinia massiliensis]|uniref:CaiF/GrlA family transcriptional regulator n=1 Tax=Yersinia massiliensis TaxID=419257 RepID=UPI0006ACD227|nr:CaiF/GrlA family transcriptional regulator [Yersinia massiliensis]
MKQLKSDNTESHNFNYHIPENLKHLSNNPLYFIVAHWALLEDKPVGRDEISAAFHITLRQASDILHYICHRHTQGNIVFHTRKFSATNGYLRLCIIVESIFPVAAQTPKPQRTIPTDNTVVSKSVEKENKSKLARWLLRRPSIGDIEKFEAWQATCPIHPSQDCCT